MKLIWTLFLAVLIGGCGNEVAVTEGDWVSVNTNSGNQARVKEVTLPSGRHCVVLVGYNKGAITCDWSK